MNGLKVEIADILWLKLQQKEGYTNDVSASGSCWLGANCVALAGGKAHLKYYNVVQYFCVSQSSVLPSRLK